MKVISHLLRRENIKNNSKGTISAKKAQKFWMNFTTCPKAVFSIFNNSGSLVNILRSVSLSCLLSFPPMKLIFIFKKLNYIQTLSLP